MLASLGNLAAGWTQKYVGLSFLPPMGFDLRLRTVVGLVSFVEHQYRS
jgi:hypothetical protein